MSILSEIQSIIDYDHETGAITRLDRNGGLGSIDSYGYLIIKIKGKQYKAHRLAWLYYYGFMPTHTIDHINNDKLDNRISNLRDVTQAVNASCIKHEPNPETGVVGVHVDKCTKGLKKIFATKYKSKTYRFHSIAEAIVFRKQKLMRV